MRFHQEFIQRYIAEAPLALALERSFECHILSRQEFHRPILDIGCGDGIFASILFAEKIDVGVDPDNIELERARETGKYAELVNCSAQHIPKPDKSFKTAFANSVLEHIQPIEKILTEARRVLADDGRMYLTLPTDKFDRYTCIHQILSGLGLKRAAARFSIFFNGFWSHYHYYDRAGWKKLFQDCGWRIVQCREYDPKSQCLLHDGLVLLSVPSFLSRKFLKRWFFFPGLRRLYTPILAALFRPLILRRLPLSNQGGLIFFELRKK